MPEENVNENETVRSIAKFLWERDKQLKFRLTAENKIEVDQTSIIKLLMDYQKWYHDNMPVNKRSLVLTRENLQKDKKRKHFNCISRYDFKPSSMSLREMREAERIIFVDGDQDKDLKNRGN